MRTPTLHPIAIVVVTPLVHSTLGSGHIDARHQKLFLLRHQGVRDLDFGSPKPINTQNPLIPLHDSGCEGVCHWVAHTVILDLHRGLAALRVLASESSRKIHFSRLDNAGGRERAGREYSHLRPTVDQQQKRASLTSWPSHRDHAAHGGGPPAMNRRERHLPVTVERVMLVVTTHSVGDLHGTHRDVVAIVERIC